MVASNHAVTAAAPSCPAPLDRFARYTGTTVGLWVAVGMLALATILRVDVARIAPTDAFAVATLLTGPIVGALMAGQAWRATTLRSWAWVVVGLAALAVVVGACGVSAIGMVTMSGSSSQPALLVIPAFLSAGLTVALVGTVLVGPLALPFTLIAAVAWAWWMARLRRATRP